MIEKLLDEVYWDNFEEDFLQIAHQAGVGDYFSYAHSATLSRTEIMVMAVSDLMSDVVYRYSTEFPNVPRPTDVIIMVKEIIPLIDLKVLRAFILREIAVFTNNKFDPLMEQQTDVKKLWTILDELYRRPVTVL